MDAKITKRRLSEMLQYDWIKILGVIVAAVILWELIFVVSAVRVSNGQNFKIYYYPTLSSTGAGDLYDFIEEEKPLSYDVLEIGIETLTNDYADTILGLRLTTGEGDIMMIDHQPVATEGHEDDRLYDQSNFYKMVDTYTMAGFDDLLDGAKTYLAQFMEGGVYVENGALVEESVRSHFIERMKGDNRFRSEENRESGVIQEKERLEKLKTSVKDFAYLLENCPELFYEYTRYQYSAHTGDNQDIKDYYEEHKEELTHPYALNAGYLESYRREDGPSVSDIAAIATGDNEGKSTGVAIMVFDFTEEQPDLQYETIAFLTQLVRTYSTLLDGAQ